MNDLKIIYNDNKPYGIRNLHGFLFLFPGIIKYGRQEERYKRELEEQHELANYLLDCLERKAT
ncbi:MAG: hypothetical protein GY853_13970 [PVC group bacterium]|nr:hypothetical protein [PVC group bacterium]